MKIVLIGAVGLAVMMAGAALAATGVVTGKGTSTSQVDACLSAKQDARRAAEAEAMYNRVGTDKLKPVTITGFGTCQCEQNDSSGYWACSVDAQYKYEDGEEESN